MLGLIILCIFIIILAVCIAPWWFLPVSIGYFILIEMLKGISKSKPRRIHPKNTMTHLEKVKREIEERKKKEDERAKQNNNNTNNKNRSSAIGDTAAILGGATLMHHHIANHHKHYDAKDSFDEDMDLWDPEPDDLYDAGIEDTDYDDIAAYDDYLASLDD